MNTPPQCTVRAGTYRCTNCFQAQAIEKWGDELPPCRCGQGVWLWFSEDNARSLSLRPVYLNAVEAVTAERNFLEGEGINIIGGQGNRFGAFIVTKVSIHSGPVGRLQMIHFEHAGDVDPNLESYRAHFVAC